MIWYPSHKPYSVLSCQEQLIGFVISLEEGSSIQNQVFRKEASFSGSTISLIPHPFSTHIEKENVCILLNQILETVIRLPIVNKIIGQGWANIVIPPT